MQYQEFIKRVQERTDLQSEEKAESVTRATFETLAEHEAAQNNSKLFNRLPTEIAEFFGKNSNAENFDSQEFVKRVASRAGVEDLNSAAQYASGVLAILQDSVEREDFDKFRAEFSEDFNPLFELKNTEALSARY